MAYEDFVKLWNEQEPSPPPPSSLGEQAKLGAVRDAPLGLAALADLVASIAVPGAGASSPNARALGALLPADVSPQTAGQRLARAGAGGATSGLLTLPLAGGGMAGLAGRAALEAASGAAGGLAGQGAAEMGLPWWAQMGANMAAGAGTNALVNRAVSPRIAAAREIAGRLPVDRRAQQIAALDESLRTGRGVTTAQGLGREGGQSIAQLEQAIAPNDPAFATAVSGRVLGEEDAIARELGAIRGTSTADPTKFLRAAEKEAIAAEKAAWGRVPASVTGGVQVDGIASSARSLVDEVAEAREILPKQAYRMAQMEGTRSIDQLQQLRSSLTDTARSAAMSGKGKLARNASRLAREIDETIERLDVPGAGPEVSAALKEARKATRVRRVRFDERLATQKAMSGGYAGARLSDEIPVEAEVGRVVRAGFANPSEVANNVRIMRSQGPDAVAAYKGAFMDEMVGTVEKSAGEKAFNFTANASIRRLKENAKSARLVLGDDGYRNAMDVLHRMKRLETTISGRPAAARIPGSNRPGFEYIAHLMSGNVSPASSIPLAGPAWRYLSGKVTGRDTAAKLTRAMLLDRQLTRDMLSDPSKLDYPAWASRMDAALARAGVRAAAMENEPNE